MSVRLKLLVIVTFVALVPPGFMAYTTLGLHQTALRRKISEVHVRSAKYGAALVETNLERAVLSLRPTIESSIEWARLNASEREGALWLLHGQLPSIAVTALLDARGQVLATTVSAAAEAPTQSASILPLLAASLNVRQVLERGMVHGSPLRASGDKRLLLPVGFRVAGAEGPCVLLIGLDMAQACNELLRDKLEHAQVMLTEGSRRTLCAYPQAQEEQPLDRDLAEQLSHGERVSLRYLRADGTEMLAAAAATPWGFRVIVAQPLKEAFAVSARMRLESLLWLAIGAVSAVGAGLLLARGITRPLLRLARGAELVAQGQFGVRLEVDGNDELAGVTASFNRMCGEIETREKEIRAWN